jgi:hypothetical protein
MHFSKIVIVTATAALMPLASHAARVKSDGILSIGGTTFDDFSCGITYWGFATANGCAKIHVSTATDPDPGLQFASSFTAGSRHFNSFVDKMIGYHVRSDVGINHIGLNFNEGYFGSAFAAVTEDIFTGDQEVGSARITCSPFQRDCTQSVDVALNGRYTDLWVTTDIAVSNSHGLKRVWSIEETFDPTPTPTPAPEPSSLAMLTTGLLGAGGFLCRRAKLSVRKEAHTA